MDYFTKQLIAMTYTIGKTQRNLMILSAALLTVITLYNAFYFLGLKPGIEKPHSAEMIIRDLLFTIPHIYLLLVLFDYFRHQGWKVLQYTLLFTAIIEIIYKAFNMIKQIGSFIPANFYYSAAVTSILAITIIIQAIFLLQIKRKDYPEVFSLQKYTIGLILLQIIAFGIPVVVRSNDSNSMMLVIRTLSGIPYLFLIEFALKLKLKEDIVADSRISS